MECCYFLSDARRVLKSYEIYAAILGVAVSLYFSLENRGLVNGNVLYTYVYATEMSGMMIAYVFCAFPYAASMCEDLEYKYIRYQTARGSLKRYVASKVSVIYLTSVAVMVLGSMVFVFLCRTQGPWVNPEADDVGVYLAGVYGGLIEEGHYAWYCMFYALQLGLLAGMLSVLAAFFSLYITNKVTVFALPVLIYQILLESSGSGKFTVYAFCAYNKYFARDWQCLLSLFLVSMGFVTILAWGIFKKLRTRM
jgi:hypothetical protein